MNQKNINFQFQGRYFQLGEINDHTENLIIVLHGYGQQAKYFIRKFKALDQLQNCIIAPEGLSKFYLEGFSGRVGATWMTKENRLVDIENYIAYLNAIYKTVTMSHTHLKTSIIGFSQGAATASRWAMQAQIPFDKLVLWAGIFPPDMDYKVAAKIFNDKMIHYVYGTEDPFITEERLTEMKILSRKLGVKPSVTTFEGGHDIHAGTLNKLF